MVAKFQLDKYAGEVGKSLAIRNATKRCSRQAAHNGNSNFATACVRGLRLNVKPLGGQEKCGSSYDESHRIL